MIANPNDGNSPRVEVATPTISVSSGGLITAKTEQEKGYVPGGTKSATQQLPTQGAKTVTPGTTTQTAVASGRYTTGDVDVAGDANLKAENIAEGVSIFGVTGTHSGGGEIEPVDVIIGAIDKLYTLAYLSTNGEVVVVDFSSEDVEFTTNVASAFMICTSSTTSWSFNLYDTAEVFPVQYTQYYENKTFYATYFLSLPRYKPTRSWVFKITT